MILFTCMKPAVNLSICLLATAITISACGGGGGSPAGPAFTRGQHNRGSTSQQSTNWSGYGIFGATTGYNSVSGMWTVPTIVASSRDTASSTWLGIGGGCTDANCTAVDPTLIQAGTEQDNSGGAQQYYAWWEAIPAPSVQATGGPLSKSKFDVSPGDIITVTISSTGGVVWTIEIDDSRSGAPHWQFTTTVPYSAAGLTAEWIEESPLTVGSNGAGQIAMSDFVAVNFSNLTVDGSNPNLTPSEQIVLVNSNGAIIAQPSDPGPGGDSFKICFGSKGC